MNNDQNPKAAALYANCYRKGYALALAADLSGEEAVAYAHGFAYGYLKETKRGEKMKRMLRVELGALNQLPAA